MTERPFLPARLRPSHRRRIGFGCAASMVAALAAPAQAADAPVIAVGEPAGFSDLTSQQRFLVDVYFGDQRRGEITVLATPDTMRIPDPDTLIGLLPGVSDPQVVQRALGSGDLPANSQLACSTGSDRARCGLLSPEIAGVIFDRDRLRLDVFVNPRYLGIEEDESDKYLADPGDGVSMIHAIGGVLSGASGDSPSFYSLQDRMVLARGTGRLRADLEYASHGGAAADRVVLEWDRPELRFSAGAMWIPGNELSGRDKAIGFGVESQLDTRLDKDEIAANPLIVYLDRRARIGILRGGQLLGSAIYEAGNQSIDTANFPEGSYEVVLQIEEPGRPARQERRFFTKSRRLPSLGRTDFFAFGGLLVDGPRRGSLRPSRHPVVQGGIAHRVDENWALAGTLRVTDDTAAAELGATWLTPIAQVTARGVADFDGRYGGIVQLASSGSSRFNVNLDLRHIESSAGRPGADAFAPAEDGSLRPAASWSGTSYSQVGGIVSFSLANLRFLAVGSYRAQREQPESYSIGPSIEWDALREGPLTLSFRTDVTATDRGIAKFAGVSLRLTGGRTSIAAAAGAGASSIPDDTIGNGPVASLAGSWSTDPAGGQLSLTAGLDHTPRQEDLVLSSEFRHPVGSLAGDLVRTDRGSATLYQYSVNAQTTFVAGPSGAQVAGKTTSDAIIVARVDGAQPGDRFEVLVNDQRSGTIDGDRPLTLALPAYRNYSVRIRSTGDAPLAYDSTPQGVALYPGTVAPLQWTAARQSLKLGRMVDPEGDLVRHAFITGAGVWSETDDNGLFQIEAADDVELTVSLRDGRSFTIRLPRARANEGIARLGDVVCCGRGATRLGALDAAAPTMEGSTR
jgi:hypothetical protein